MLALCVAPLLSRAQSPAVQTGSETGANVSAPSAVQTVDQQQAGSITGTVEDTSGAVSVGAHVKLMRSDQSPAEQEVITGDNGQFSFQNVAPGPFHLTIEAPGFVTEDVPGELSSGQFYIVPLVTLAVSGGSTEVSVGGNSVEVAEEQIKVQETQRIFGIIPNFYVTYEPDPVPLIARQKFQLAWRSVKDPVTIVGAGVLAGFQQASNDFAGYGQGMQGYAKRFGASYADIFAGTFIGSAILPSILKQDPRYFYRGTGSTGSRIAYALGNSVICKGDNKKWQVNYSSIIGSFATGGVSYLYYPKSDRGAGLLVQNSMLRLAESSLAGVFQEFVLRKLTTRVGHNRDQLGGDGTSK